MTNIFRVDIKIWILLQNIASLPSDFVRDSDEYQLFKDATESGAEFAISEKDILDDNIEILYGYQDFTFDTFSKMIYAIKEILEVYELTECKKYKLLIKAMPRMELIALENKLDSMTVSSF